ncbi:MAG: ATP-binding cassette domain-containing protein [Actinobacteria bacterium]|nr:ATP-binding cassette domain-containing protein [Actinomycetota bacterium]
MHAIMGPNGSGKSTLASTLLAADAYEVTSGKVFYKGEDISTWSTTERAKHGMFLGFQYPQELRVYRCCSFCGRRCRRARASTFRYSSCVSQRWTG